MPYTVGVHTVHPSGMPVHPALTTRDMPDSLLPGVCPDSLLPGSKMSVIPPDSKMSVMPPGSKMSVNPSGLR